MISDGLRISYSDASSVATRLSDCGENFHNLLNQIMNINENLKNYWEGSDAAKYSRAVEEQAKVMEQLAKRIEATGDFLIAVTQEYQSVQDNNVNSINL